MVHEENRNQAKLTNEEIGWPKREWRAWGNSNHCNISKQEVFLVPGEDL